MEIWADKQLWGSIAAVLAFANFAPLFWAMYKGETKPHLLSYVIWFGMTAMAFAAQVAGGAGAGAWTTGVSALLSLIVALWALRVGHKDITRMDWACLLLGLMGMALWALTRNPLYAAMIAAGVDALGYVPTARKSWRRPHQENARQYAIANLKWVASLLAMNEYTMTTLVFPVVIMLCNSLLFSELMLRRHVLQVWPGKWKRKP